MAKHKLMTKEVEALLPKLYSTEVVPTEQKVAVVKYFLTGSRYTLYVVEAEKLPDGDFQFFGYCISPDGPECDEWGYTNLSQLAAMKNKMGLGVERDLYFKPTKVRDLMNTH